MAKTSVCLLHVICLLDLCFSVPYSSLHYSCNDFMIIGSLRWGGSYEELPFLGVSLLYFLAFISSPKDYPDVFDYLNQENVVIFFFVVFSIVFVADVPCDSSVLFTLHRAQPIPSYCKEFLCPMPIPLLGIFHYGIILSKPHPAHLNAIY